MDGFLNWLNSFWGGLSGVLIAVLLLILAFIVAAIVKALFVKLVAKTKLGDLLAKADKDTPGQTLNLLGKLVYLIVFLLFVPGILIFAANGILSVLTTVFLSNSVDYGELKTGHREESVIFSMQTFVVKLASGVSVFIAGVGLSVIGLVGNTEEQGPITQQSAGTIMGLRLLMTIMPVVLLICAILFFTRKFRLTDDVVKANAEKLGRSR